MSIFISKDVQKVLKTLRERGATITDHHGSKHNKIKITLPNGQSFVWLCSKTPSDHRTPLNEVSRLRRQLREAGFEQSREIRLG